MQRRRFLGLMQRSVTTIAGGTLLGLLSAAGGCAGHRYGHILKSDDADLVGSHEAGAAVWNPLVDQCVAKLLGRCDAGVSQTGSFENPALAPGELPPPPPVPGPATVCFIALENKSAEELIDFKDQLYQRIDSQVNSSGRFRMISRRMVDGALRETRLRPDSLFLPVNRDLFAMALGRQGSPVDFLLYGTITSGTTEKNKSTQRDYDLTLEMVNVHSGEYVKETATIRKGYHQSVAGKWWNYGFSAKSDD